MFTLDTQATINGLIADSRKNVALSAEYSRRAQLAQAAKQHHSAKALRQMSAARAQIARGLIRRAVELGYDEGTDR